MILVNLEKKNPQRRGADRISAHIARIKVPPSFQEESSESTVKKSLKQFGYSDPEDMPKYRTEFISTSPSKGEANDAEASKN